ncbi:MAG: hypothetical protein MAG451_01812 [Anaerolineales bacterium]|nr:hypothetical protein [Anaerolineales bacterium]
MIQQQIPCELSTVQAELVVDEPSRLDIVANPQDGLAKWRLLEQSTYELILRGIGNREIEVWIGDRSVTDAVRVVGDGAYCQLNWGNFVGASRIRVDLAGHTTVDLPVEVRSYNLEYQTHYRRLLDDLAEKLAALCFAYQVPTTTLAEVKVQETTTPYLTYLLVAHLMHPQRLPAALQRITLEPHRQLVRESIWREFSAARNVSSRTIRSIVIHGEHLAPYQGGAAIQSLRQSLAGHVPLQLHDERTRIDLDTPPNRFVRHALETLSRKLLKLEQVFGEASRKLNEPPEQVQSLIQDCRRWSREVAGFLRAPYLEETGRLDTFPLHSQVLLRQDGYRQVRDMYLRLLLTAHVRWTSLEDLLRLPNKDLATLYEYWCCFALADATAKLLKIEPDWSGVLSVERGIYEIRLNQQGRFRIPLGNVTLDYNPWFRHNHDGGHGSYSVNLRPDFAFSRGGRHWIFDAKYRVNSSEIMETFQSSSEVEADGEGEDQIRSFKTADLYKMHTYRDAIEGAVAVFTLYPGNDFRAFGTDGEIYVQPAEMPADFSGVGAVPLLPGQTATLEEFLKRIF